MKYQYYLFKKQHKKNVHFSELFSKWPPYVAFIIHFPFTSVSSQQQQQYIDKIYQILDWCLEFQIQKVLFFDAQGHVYQMMEPICSKSQQKEHSMDGFSSISMRNGFSACHVQEFSTFFPFFYKHKILVGFHSKNTFGKSFILEQWDASLRNNSTNSEYFITKFGHHLEPPIAIVCNQQFLKLDGFNPLALRYTEFAHVKECVLDFCKYEFFDCLLSYATCHQRFGT